MKVSRINMKGFWPAVVGGAALIGSSIASGLLGRSNAKEAGGMSEDAYRQRYQWTVRDMKEAGLNPILAASGGFNVGSGVNYPAAPPPPPIDLSSMFGASAQQEKVSQEVENMKQDILNKKQAVNESLQRVEKERAQTGLITQQEKNAIGEWNLIQQKITNAIGEYERISSQAALNWRSKELVNENIKQVQQEIEKTKYVIMSLRKVGKAYEGPIGGILGYIKAVSEALGLHTSLGGGVTSTVRMLK